MQFVTKLIMKNYIHVVFCGTPILMMALVFHCTINYKDDYDDVHNIANGNDGDDDDIRPGPGIPWHSNTQRECHSRNAGMEHSPGSPLMSIIIIKKTGHHADNRES